MLVKLKSLLVFSEINEKYFYTEFSDEINIIKGKNTSGKSTLIQSILYTLGINNDNEKLREILNEQLIFRLDIEKKNKNETSQITFIRENQTFFIFENAERSLRFDGISADQSSEHIKLKKIISSIFDFNLALESKGEMKEAPLETMLLPYYISQSVGWVYLRESFSGLNFYKNFKNDYLDYYLGITTDLDRISLHNLLRKKHKILQEINFLEEIKKNNSEIQISQLLDEEFKSEANKYLNDYSELRENQVKQESRHTHLCNQKSLESNRQLVLRKIKRNISRQRPDIDSCPVCSQTLPSSLESVYSHHQKINDTENEITSTKGRIIHIQSDINSTQKKIEKINNSIEEKYSVIIRYESTSKEITFDSWLNQKSNLKLLKKIDCSMAEKASELSTIIRDIEGVDTDKDAESARFSKEKSFLNYFKENLFNLGVPLPEEEQYKKLYKINSFPFQGVELHKTVMAYHFALNRLIAETEGIHRFPFILDAVMKEDIDEENRIKIFKFLEEKCPTDTQMIFSISESLSHSKDDTSSSNNIELVNETYFNNKAKIIQIGDGDSERSFLSPYNGEHKELISATLEMASTA